MLYFKSRRAYFLGYPCAMYVLGFILFPSQTPVQSNTVLVDAINVVASTEGVLADVLSDTELLPGSVCW